jgi:competence protein ComEC
LAYAIIAVIVFWRHLNYKRLVSGILAAFCLFDIGYWHIKPLMGKNLEVTFLDVGHGDSIVVRFPNNYVVLIDGGGIKGSDFDIGKHVVAPALLRMGIHHVDSLVLTHPHHDHYKGLAAIAEKFGPATLYTNGANAPEEELSDWEEFLGRVEKSHVSISPIQESSNINSDFSMEEGGAKLEIVAPRAREVALLDANDASLVIKLSVRKRSFLLTGDLMRVGESTLVDRRRDLSSDVLKVGHHGSETSSSLEFLKAVKPSVAVITVGEHNQYGVPDQVVLNRLGDFGARIYRTDIDGAITIRTDGDSINVDTFVKNPKH